MTRWTGTPHELRERLIKQAQRQDADVWATLDAADSAPAGPRPSKYGNMRAEVDGIAFDSQAELQRYHELRLLQRASELSDLCPAPDQPVRRRYVLSDGPKPPVYVPDFTYQEGERWIAEDVKGGKATQTAVFKLKAKLFRERYPHIELRIIER